MALWSVLRSLSHIQSRLTIGFCKFIFGCCLRYWAMDVATTYHCTLRHSCSVCVCVYPFYQGADSGSLPVFNVMRLEILV